MGSGPDMHGGSGLYAWAAILLSTEVITKTLFVEEEEQEKDSPEDKKEVKRLAFAKFIHTPPKQL